MGIMWSWVKRIMRRPSLYAVDPNFEPVYGWSSTLTLPKLRELVQPFVDERIAGGSLKDFAELRFEMNHSSSDDRTSWAILDSSGITLESYVNAFRNADQYFNAYHSITTHILTLTFNETLTRAYLQKWIPLLLDAGVPMDDCYQVIDSGFRRNSLGYKYVTASMDRAAKRGKSQPYGLLKHRSDKYFRAVVAAGYENFTALREHGFSLNEILSLVENDVDIDLAISLKDGSV